MLSRSLARQVGWSSSRLCLLVTTAAPNLLDFLWNDTKRLFARMKKISIRLVLETAILCGLVCVALMLMVGLATTKPDIVTIATFWGYALVVVSSAIYFAFTVVAVIRKCTAIVWGSLTPINFGLSLLGMTAVMSPLEGYMGMLVLGIGGVVAAYVSCSFLRGYIELGATLFVNGLLLLPLLPDVAPYWVFLFVPLSVFLIAVPVFCTLIHSRKAPLHDK